MSIPARRDVSFGTLASNEAGDDLGAVVTVTASVPALVWQETGESLVSVTLSEKFDPDEELLVPLIPSDLSGWLLNGEAIVVDSTQPASHVYDVTIQAQDQNGAPVGSPIRADGLLVPSGTGKYDASSFIRYTGPTGVTISIPDLWSEQVAAAQAAAEAAETAASNASAVTDSGVAATLDMPETSAKLRAAFVAFVRSDNGAPLAGGKVVVKVDPTTHEIVDILWEA